MSFKIYNKYLDFYSNLNSFKFFLLYLLDFKKTIRQIIDELTPL
jgi:hypothetical protein